ncbi:MAG: hypothetical protein A3A80_01590 [Candidatus Terrybacteria bacterium RIFCSPLOWO2_01_FULL_44_24]|uniref:Uncharacterized protein n=1 Tax=Candidatus Terrybacteria bacterium RIFCSPHIGHO2_01_FULL_43_35 TaxID=1802361 RepID=A0A1G2PFH8_9BACT|nr:MAG: hypothetical protein A2828_03965 [Candidatus Terrybacteria bacterium RIFCSPHIGHO2_01_FULL_43_35]OHA49909.1 MAG: hypothetical protein A3B75_03335 [Candidatus Terrybacteria bacterium RIFCSPHIGHO2_02_FULL_43_14]OHA51770.1 MAG: hypothetical protein A3A80_01590 [Candidatus Terrybacteria bacterium RIFCSPLOWO2_01_FULL_44_24]
MQMLNKLSVKTIGFLQATCLVVYVSVVALAMHYLSQNTIFISQILSIIIFLLVFVISALISSSIILGYPLIMFFNGKKEEAVRIVLWSIVWLVIFAAVFILIGLIWLT